MKVMWSKQRYILIAYVTIFPDHQEKLKIFVTIKKTRTLKNSGKNYKFNYALAMKSLQADEGTIHRGGPGTFKSCGQLHLRIDTMHSLNNEPIFL